MFTSGVSAYAMLVIVNFFPFFFILRLEIILELFFSEIWYNV